MNGNEQLSPQLEAFLREIRSARRLVLGQVLILMDPGKAGEVFELRHLEDAGAAVETLSTCTPREMRSKVQHNEHGAFRPLRTSPDMIRGWRVVAVGSQVLEEALECIYPGALADWFAAQKPQPPVTHFREFTQRQTGMFRVITRLDDAQAAETIRACCTSSFCIRRRLWTVPGLEPDAADRPGKSVIPCLEPCALLMELARKAARFHQETADKGSPVIRISWEDLRTLRSLLEKERDCPTSQGRQADFADPHNPRRLQWLLERLPSVVEEKGSAGGGE